MCTLLVDKRLEQSVEGLTSPKGLQAKFYKRNIWQFRSIIRATKNTPILNTVEYGHSIKIDVTVIINFEGTEDFLMATTMLYIFALSIFLEDSFSLHFPAETVLFTRIKSSTEFKLHGGLDIPLVSTQMKESSSSSPALSSQSSESK